jgi:hypothetical protein
MIEDLNFFDVIPVRGLFLATATLVLLALEAGYSLGLLRCDQKETKR